MDLSSKDMKHVNRAMDECRHSTMLMRHGCIVADGTKVLSSGHNHYRTRFGDKFITQSCSCHAEMDALRKAVKSKSSSCNVRKRVGQRYQKVV